MFNFGYGFRLSSEMKNKIYLESSIEADKILTDLGFWQRQLRGAI